MRNFIFLVMITLLGTPAFAAPAESLLTGKTLIAGDVITLADLFTNTGRNASHVLAPAPRAGDKLVLSKADLQRVVTAFHLNWKSSATAPMTITLERDASVISQDKIIAALNDSELKTTVNPDAQFKITNLTDDVVVNGKEPVELAISAPHFDAVTEKFTVQMDIKRGENVLKTVAIEGLATTFIKVPVLRYPAVNNTVLSAADIIEISVPKNEINNDTIAAKAELVGMTARRGLMPNQPISRQDVSPPVMVKRNELITVTYKNGPIVLTAKARSLSAGTEGDTVTLMNVTSKKSFEAKVTGYQQAEVNLDG